VREERRGCEYCVRIRGTGGGLTPRHIGRTLENRLDRMIDR
jgi:hypothetical protein